MKHMLFILFIAAAFAFPMDFTSKRQISEDDSSRKRQRTEDFNLVDITIDLYQLLTLKLWETPKQDQDRVYLQPSDETETNRNEFIKKFTVGAEIFQQLILPKNQLTDEEANRDDNIQEIPLSIVKSDILTVLLNLVSKNNLKVELGSFRYIKLT